MSLDELFELNKKAQISPEAAGAGFAISIAMAKKYHGQETSSIQVLREAGIQLTEEPGPKKIEQPYQKQETQDVKPIEERSLLELYQAVLKTYIEQSEGWKKRNLFERQWVSRDFKKTTGMSIDEMQTNLKALESKLKKNQATGELVQPLEKLGAYYVHQQEQLKGFEKDSKKLQENLKIIEGWIFDTNQLIQVLTA